MKTLLLSLSLALGSTVLCGQTGVAPVEFSEVTIYTEFDHPPSAILLEQMQAELDLIMAPVGLHFGWRSLEHVSGREVVAEIVVVTFKGECQTGDAFLPVREAGPLGCTNKIPFLESWASWPLIATSLTIVAVGAWLIVSPLAVSLPPQRDRLMGRAMARVIAHEMYHFFTNTTRHASTGIAKASIPAPN